MKKQGISLIVLVITVVVIGILAGIAVTSFNGNIIIDAGELLLDENTLNNIREAANIAYDKLLIEYHGNESRITEDIIKQKVMELGINKQDIARLSFGLGENVQVGYKKDISPTSTISNKMSGILSLKIYGNSVQQGEPSPTNPAEIQSVGERTKNLFDINKVISNKNVKNNGDGTLSVKATATSSGSSANSPRMLKDYAPELEVGKTYILSGNSTGSAKRIYLSVSKSIWAFGTSRTITQSDLDSNVVWYANGDTDTTFTAVISDIQIEEGTVATAYEPYGYKIPITVTNDTGSTVHNIYLDEPLRKIGNYADYIDFEKNTLVREVGEKRLTGIENWQVATATYGYRTYIPDAEGMFIVKERGIGLSNRFKIVNGLSIVGEFITRTQGGIQFAQDWAATKTEWADWVENNNIIIQYPLVKSISNSIDLPQITTISGNTSININTKIAPSSVELFYQYN